MLTDFGLNGWAFENGFHIECARLSGIPIACTIRDPTPLLGVVGTRRAVAKSHRVSRVSSSIYIDLVFRAVDWGRRILGKLKRRSSKANHLLFEIMKSRRKTAMINYHMKALPHVLVHEKRFVDANAENDSTDLVRLDYLKALEELEAEELVEPCSSSREIFRLTAKGVREATKLKEEIALA